MNRVYINATAAIFLTLCCDIRGQSAEPSYEELLFLLREWMPGPRATDISAYASSPAIRTAGGMFPLVCNLYPFIELIGFTIIGKDIASQSVEYNIKLHLRWTAGLEDIKRKTACIAGQTDFLGVPIKGNLAGNPYYRAPIKFVLSRAGSRWKLRE